MPPGYHIRLSAFDVISREPLPRSPIDESRPRTSILVSLEYLETGYRELLDLQNGLPQERLSAQPVTSTAAFLGDIICDMLGTSSRMEDSELLRLDGEATQLLLDALQMYLDLAPSAHLFRRTASHLIIKVADRSSMLPSSLFMEDLKCSPHSNLGGGYADVYEGTYAGVPVAIKLSRTIESQAIGYKRLCREALVWRQLHHPHVLPFLGLNHTLFPFSSIPCIITPWMKNGMLKDFVKTPYWNPERDIVAMLLGISSGLEYLYSIMVIHGDISHTNILIDDQHQPQLADFGLVLLEEVTSGCFTATSNGRQLRWASPERINGDVRTKSDDVYSFGCMIYYLYSRLVPFQNQTELAVMMKVTQGKRPSRPQLALGGPCQVEPLDSMWRLVELCWHQAADHRPAMSFVHARLQHTYLSGHKSDWMPTVFINVPVKQASEGDVVTSIPVALRSTRFANLDRLIKSLGVEPAEWSALSPPSRPQTQFYSDEDYLVPTPPSSHSLNYTSLSKSIMETSSSHLNKSSNSYPSLDGTQAVKLPKRTYALLKLLSCERTYASDLALACNVHIPMATGRSPWISNPALLDSAIRDVSVSNVGAGPPMRDDDVKIIFGNMPELAAFSSHFCDCMELALGSVLEGGSGPDHMGALFLDTIPELAMKYKPYITRHLTALEHLHRLPSTPKLKTYLARTQALTTAITTGWDLHALLVKPVECLLNYSLLLDTIIAETSVDHSDYAKLVLAKARLLDLTREVNEDQRRREIVHEVLSATVFDATKLGLVDNSRNRLGKLKRSTSDSASSVDPIASIQVPRFRRLSMIRSASSEGRHPEEIAVHACAGQLRNILHLAIDLKVTTLAWADAVSASTYALRPWAVTLARVLGDLRGQPRKCEIVERFLDATNAHLKVCRGFQNELRQDLLPALTRLLESAEAPKRLLAVLAGLPSYQDVIVHPAYSKHQLSLALRGQLAAELPLYLNLLRKGISAYVAGLADAQARYFSSAATSWAEPRNSLPHGNEDVLRINHKYENEKAWWARFVDVAARIDAWEATRTLSPAKGKRK